jgi:hypothetical protein
MRTLPPSRPTENAAAPPRIDWNGRFGVETSSAEGPGWIDDFVNKLGKDELARNPNAGIRLRPPGA